jgi:hypothetical protein
MITLFHQRHHRRLVHYFAGELAPDEARRLFAHLRRCDACRAAQLALSLADGEGAEGAAARHQRLERALLGAPESSPRAARRPALAWGLGALGALATAALLLLVLGPQLGEEAAFRAKGGEVDGGERTALLYVYRVAPDGGYRRVKGRVRSGEPLAFAYSNTAADPEAALPDRLLVFGMDEHYTVYWFCPVWRDAKQNPGPCPIRRGRGLELPRQVAHEIEGRALRLFGVFSRRRDLTVRRVEALIARVKKSGRGLRALERLPLEGTVQWTRLLEVAR